jgi:uncharacterized protein YdaU (DUF1376 family)
MPGLSRFDFYPRDWLSGTRLLSDRAKGCYVDLLCAMYDRGGPLPYIENELVSLCGYKNVRSLRHVLKELFEKGKIEEVDGYITNARAISEIAKANQRIEKGRNAANAKWDRNEADTGSIPSPNQPDNDQGIEGKQGLNPCPPSPSSSPPDSSKKKNLKNTKKSKIDPVYFRRFWDVYPNPVAEGHAEPAFEKATKHATPEEIIAGAERYAEQTRQEGTPRKFMTGPVKWLTGKCWLDVRRAEPTLNLNLVTEEVEQARRRLSQC